MENKHHLLQQIAELQQKWELLSQKLQRLEREKILETRSDEKFRIENLIAELVSERQKIGQQLSDLESPISIENRNVGDGSDSRNSNNNEKSHRSSSSGPIFNIGSLQGGRDVNVAGEDINISKKNGQDT